MIQSKYADATTAGTSILYVYVYMHVYRYTCICAYIDISGCAHNYADTTTTATILALAPML